jgi:glycosyltransferase involved in cell wall biosynthesis
MRIAVCILTYNQYAHDRRALFEQTVASLRENAIDDVDIYVVDNGSSDGTADLVRDLGGYCYQGTNTTSGHGTNLAAQVARGSHADLCVLSDDDMAWQPAWDRHLVDWYQGLPHDVKLTGCHLEPEYPWNAIRDTIEVNGRRGLIRASTGAASWSFRNGDWPAIGPIPQVRQGWGDVPACQRLEARGYRIAQIDLATHCGGDRSTWGNGSSDLNRHSFDRDRWGL